MISARSLGNAILIALTAFAAIFASSLTVNAATLTATEVTLDGLTLSWTAADTSNTVTNDSKTMFYISNNSGAAISATVPAQVSTVTVAGYGDISISDAAIDVPAGALRYIGTFPKRSYTNSSGKVRLNLTSATDVSVTAIRVEPAK